MSQTVLFEFDRSRAAIAAWLELKAGGFKVLPYFLYKVPKLAFIESDLCRHEEFFETHITRLPHPHLHRALNWGLYQEPWRMLCIQQAELPNFERADLHKALIEDNELEATTPFADSARTERAGIMRPLMGWDRLGIDELLQEVAVEEPEDYKVFGTMFDVFDPDHLTALKAKWPSDYQQVLVWFPLVEYAVYRASMMEKKK